MSRHQPGTTEVGEHRDNEGTVAVLCLRSDSWESLSERKRGISRCRMLSGNEHTQHEHAHFQEEIRSAPQARWEESGFLPQMPESLEQLDLLLLSVAKGRRVQQDGIHFQGQRYCDTTLAAYVGEDVTIRYDPRDLAVIRVFYQGRFLCRAICAEFAGEHISLKEVIQARTQQRNRVRQGIKDRLSVVEQIQAGTSSESLLSELSPSPVEPATPPITPRLKRYFNE